MTFQVLENQRKKFKDVLNGVGTLQSVGQSIQLIWSIDQQQHICMVSYNFANKAETNNDRG